MMIKRALLILGLMIGMMACSPATDGGASGLPTIEATDSVPESLPAESVAPEPSAS
jgi:hypothetical protein